MRLPFTTENEIRDALPRVLDHLAADGLIAYPTETVYGFGGAATVGAVGALRELKRRDPAKSFILLVTSPDMAPGVHWNDTAKKVAERFWPGPLTLVMDAEPAAFPAGVTATDGRVALRDSPHAGLRMLLQAWSRPLTSSSANARGTLPATDADEAAAALEALGATGDVVILDGGRLPASPSSTVVACEDGLVRVLRDGAIDRDMLRERLRGADIDVA